MLSFAVDFLARETPHFIGPELCLQTVRNGGLQSLGYHTGKSASNANTRCRRFEAARD